MHIFWTDFYIACGWLLVFCGIAFIAVVAYLAVTALSLKNAAMRNLKKLYDPPLRSVKSLTATGKGIALREMIPIRKIGAQIGVIASDVKETALEVSHAAKTVHPSELKAAYLKVKHPLSIANSALHILQSLRKRQGQKA